VGRQARSSLAIATHIGGSTAADAHTAFLAGLHLALLCAAIAVAVTAVLVAALLAPRRVRSTPAPTSIKTA
jgi:hypothetical protein